MYVTGTTKRLELVEKKLDVLLDRMLRYDDLQSANVQTTPLTQPPANPTGLQYAGVQVTPTLQQPNTPVHAGLSTNEMACDEDWEYSWTRAEDMSPEYWGATSYADNFLATPIPGQQIPTSKQTSVQQPPRVVDSWQQQTPRVIDRWQKPSPVVVEQQQGTPNRQQRTPTIMDNRQQRTPMIMDNRQQRTSMIIDGPQQRSPVVIGGQYPAGEQQTPIVLDAQEQQTDAQEQETPMVVDAQEQQTPIVVPDQSISKRPPVLKQVTNNPYSLPSHHRPPRPIKAHENALPSSMIVAWDGEKTIQAVIENNHKLAKVSKVSTLAVKIAKEAVFGEMVMRKCTPMGSRELPGLPRKELFEVKQALFDLFPSYWKNSEDFESVWAACIDSIGQACKRLRSKKP